MSISKYLRRGLMYGAVAMFGISNADAGFVVREELVQRTFDRTVPVYRRIDSTPTPCGPQSCPQYEVQYQTQRVTISKMEKHLVWDPCQKGVVGKELEKIREKMQERHDCHERRHLQNICQPQCYVPTAPRACYQVRPQPCERVQPQPCERVQPQPCERVQPRGYEPGQQKVYPDQSRQPGIEPTPAPIDEPTLAPPEPPKPGPEIPKTVPVPPRPGPVDNTMPIPSDQPASVSGDKLVQDLADLPKLSP